MHKIKSTVLKTVSVFSAVCISLGAFHAVAAEESSNCGRGVTYNVTEKILTVSGAGEMDGTKPWNKYDIEKIVIEEGVTKIPQGTFADLTNLVSADIAESVTEIEDGAFPKADFDIYGLINHASGRYAKENSNVTLKMKKMRILCLGNSHTNDYNWWMKNVIKDLDKNNALITDFYVELLFPMGGRSLHTDVKGVERGTHYACAQDPNDDTYEKYQKAFEKKWDLVIIQDYDESAVIDQNYTSAKFAEDMSETVEWLRNTAVRGADIAWFADWVSKSVNGADKLNEGYQKSIESIQAVQSLTENKPDFIINGSTILANARTTYLDDTKNKADALLNWDCINKDTGKEVYNRNDFAAGNLEKYSLLERDSTHMSLELGRQLMATAVVHKIFDYYKLNIVKADSFTFFESITTAPEFVRKTTAPDGSPNPDCIWQGSFVPEYWDIIREVCENTLKTPASVTPCSEKYKTDPTVAKENAVKEVLSNVALPSKFAQSTLDKTFKEEAVIGAINEQAALSTDEDDITVIYKAPVNGTQQNQKGTDGSVEVKVKYIYGYSSPAGEIIAVRTLVSENYDSSVPRVNIKSFYDNQGKYSVDGTLSGEWNKNSVTVLLGVYSNKNLTDIQKKEIDLTKEDKSFVLESNRKGDSARIFVWDEMSRLMPVYETLTLSNREITTVNKANGVLVSWNAVPGAVSYDVYRDGVLIADNINETTYGDKYFETLEAMLDEKYQGKLNGSCDVRSAEPDKDYVYTVVTDNNIVLKSKSGRADAENKIAYIAFDKGDTTVNLLNDKGNGIKIVATDEHMKAKTTGSYDLTARYAARNVKTTADTEGYLKYKKTEYITPTVVHTGDNKGGTIGSAIALSGYNSRYGIHGGQIITGGKAYVCKTDAYGYLLNADGERIKNISDVVFTEEEDSFTFERNGTKYTTKNIYDATTTSVPYAYVDKAGFGNGEYVFLMNARINDDGWRIPSVVKNGTLEIAVAKDGVNVVETGTKIIKNESAETYSPKTSGVNGEYYTYRFKADADFGADSAESVANTEALTGQVNSFEVSRFNSSKWNLKINAANVKDFIWLHSVAIIPSSEYLD